MLDEAQAGIKIAGRNINNLNMENPRDGEPGGLPSMGLHRVGHDWSDLAAAAAVKPPISQTQIQILRNFLRIHMQQSGEEKSIN